MKRKGAFLSESFGTFRSIAPQLSFQCQVNGKALRATVLGVIDSPVVTAYRIQFSDGYVSDFYSDFYGYLTEAGDADTDSPELKFKPGPYFFAIKKDLESLLNFHIYKKSYCFNLPVRETETNLFVTYDENEDGNFYDVKYDGDYRFSLAKEKNGWWAGTKRVVEPEKVDETLARNLSLLIESQH